MDIYDNLHQEKQHFFQLLQLTERGPAHLLNLTWPLRPLTNFVMPLSVNSPSSILLPLPAHSVIFSLPFPPLLLPPFSSFSRTPIGLVSWGFLIPSLLPQPLYFLYYTHSQWAYQKGLEESCWRQGLVFLLLLHWTFSNKFNHNCHHSWPVQVCC